MERIDMIRGLARGQADLLEEYAKLTEAKERFLAIFQEMEADLEPTLPREFGPARDAFIDLKGRLNNFDAKKEAKRVADAVSRLIVHLSTAE